jgi:hypothetical protein
MLRMIPERFQVSEVAFVVEISSFAKDLHHVYNGAFRSTNVQRIDRASKTRRRQVDS